MFWIDIRPFIVEWLFVQVDLGMCNEGLLFILDQQVKTEMENLESLLEAMEAVS